MSQTIHPVESQKIYTQELSFCLELWEKDGGCTFGGGTKCHECATPYLLLKFLTGEVLHGDMKRLNLEDWKEKFREMKKSA